MMLSTSSGVHQEINPQLCVSFKLRVTCDGPKGQFFIFIIVGAVCTSPL